MTLTVYDPEKNCQVLNPEAFEPVMNAFHPDYVKTYMPEFLSTIRLEAKQKANGQISGAKTKATRESVNKNAFTISAFPRTQPRIDLNVKQYFTYSKAGAGNVKPKGKKNDVAVSTVSKSEGQG